MSPLPNIDQIVEMYREADRTAVKQRFDELFGPQRETDAPDVEDQEDITGQETDAPGADIDLRDSDRTSDDEHLDEDLDARITALELSPSISEKMWVYWANLDEYSKALALHYLDCFESRSFTPRHTLEGLKRFFGIEAASHLGYDFFPSISFPIDPNLSYANLRMILDHYGIVYDDQSDLLSFEVWQGLSWAIEEYRAQHELEDWQMWALVYDLGPRLLPKPKAYPVDPPHKIWVVATNDELGEFAEIDQHGAEYIGTTAINPKARRGDLALMYCVSPRSALVSVYRCAADAHRDPFGGWNGFRAEITDKIPIPWITFAEMKADPVMKEWRLVRGNFQGLLKHEVPREVWERIQTLVAEKVSEAGERIAQYARAAEGSRMIKVSDEKWSEFEVEEKLVIPLLIQLGWKVDRTLVRQQEMRIKVGSGRPKQVYADFVGYSDSLTSQALLVVEVKRRIGSNAELEPAVEQAESYAGKLRCGRFAFAAPEGFWVYDLQFPGQSTQLASVRLDSKVSTSVIEKLEPLIGFESLKSSG